MSAGRALALAVAGVAGGYLLGESYVGRMSDPRGLRLTAVADRVAVPAPRPARAVVVLADGLRLDAALGMRAVGWLRAAGQCRATHVGSPSISRPVYTVISSGVEQDRTGIRTNAETRPAPVESIWEVARREGMRVAARSELGWWTELFPRGFDAIEVLPRSAAYLSPAPGAGLTLIHPVYVDDAGHDHGGSSPEYAAQVARLDAELGGFLDGLDPERDLVVLTSDHGHTDRGGHGGASREVAVVLTCFAGRGVARVGDGPPISAREIAPALAVLLGLPFPRHMRASPLEGDDGLDALWGIVDAAALSAAYLEDRRAAVARFREANPPWADVYAEGRAAQGLRLGALAALLVVLIATSPRPASLALWMIAVVALAVVGHVAAFGSFDASAINTRTSYLAAAIPLWLAVAGAGLWLRRVSTGDPRRALADQMRLVGAGLCVCVGLVWIFGWPLGFPLPSPRFYFLPFFASIGTACLSLVLAAGALVLGRGVR